MEIRSALGKPSRAAQLRGVRLRYIAAALRTGAGSRVALLREEPGLIDPFIADVIEVKWLLPNMLHELPPPSEDAGAWEALWCSHPGGWKQIVSLYFAKAGQSEPGAGSQPEGGVAV